MIILEKPRAICAIKLQTMVAAPLIKLRPSNDMSCRTSSMTQSRSVNDCRIKWMRNKGLTGNSGQPRLL